MRETASYLSKTFGNPDKLRQLVRESKNVPANVRDHSTLAESRKTRAAVASPK